MNESGSPLQERSRRRLAAERFAPLPAAMAYAMRMLHASCHFTILGREYEDEAARSGRPIIYTAWHFAFPAVIYHLRDRNGMVMVSRSRDGEWVARTLKHLGFESARGSPGKGGSSALKQVIGHLRRGRPGGFIADGSQGPARVAQKGILILARHTRSPLVPVSMAAGPCWRFPSWDRTVLARPFSRVVFAYGPPLWVPTGISEDELEGMRVELEKRLNLLTRQCETALDAGRPP